MMLREQVNRQEGTLQRFGPSRQLAALRQQITELAARQERLMLKTLDLSRQNFGDNAARLEILSPLETLARGYSITVRADGRVVLDAASLSVGEHLKVTLNRGSADCRVEALFPGNALVRESIPEKRHEKPAH